MKYKIKFTYRGWVSTESSSISIKMEWSDLDVATANFNRILAHRKMCDQIQNIDWNTGKLSIEDIEKMYIDEDWFVVEKDEFVVKNGRNSRKVYSQEQKDQFIADGWQITEELNWATAKDNILLYSDEGVPTKIYASWIRSSLESIEVEIVLPKIVFSYI